MEENGMLSSTKRTKHINVRYFLMKDKIDRGEVKIEYCPTDEMIGDYFTKPLQGEKFVKFREQILNFKNRMNFQCRH